MKKVLLAVSVIFAAANVNAQTGNVGIGTTTPLQKLHVKGNAKIDSMVDATALESQYTKAVVAKPDGTLGVVSRTNPTIPGSTETIFRDVPVHKDICKGRTFKQMLNANPELATYYYNTGQSITLPPGKWTIYLGYLISTASTFDTSECIWVRSMISSNPIDSTQRSNLMPFETDSATPVYISGNLLPFVVNNMILGMYFITNTTSANKTYYIKAAFQPVNLKQNSTATIIPPTVPVAVWGEDYLVAVRRQ